MAVLLLPHCPLCGDPPAWACGLVFHDRWIHYKEIGSCHGTAHWQMLATIVERTYRAPPARPAPATGRQHVVIEV